MSAECKTLPFDLPTLTASLLSTKGRGVEISLFRRAKQGEQEPAHQPQAEPVTISGRLTVSF